MAASPSAPAALKEQTVILPPNPGENGHSHNLRLTVLAPKRRFLSYYRDRWWVALTCLLLLVGATVTYDTVEPDTYTSFAQLYLNGDIQITANNVFSEDRNYFGSQIELLKSPRLQGAAREKAGQDAPSAVPVKPVNIEVTQPMGTSILQLRATGTDPQYTQHYLQALIDEYLAYKKETRLSTSEDLLLSLNEELAKREKSLKASQDKLVEFQRTNNLAVIEEEAKSAGAYLSELNLRMAQLKLQHDLLTNGINPAEVLAAKPAGATAAPGTNQVAAAPASTGTNDTAIAPDAQLKSARLELSLLEDERAHKDLPDSSQLVKPLLSHIEQLKKTVSILEEQERAQTELAIRNLDKEIALIHDTVPPLEKHVLAITELLSQSQGLKNDIERDQGMYDHLLSLLQNVDLNKNVQQEQLSLLQAPANSLPSKRNLPLRLLLAVVVGFGASLGIVFAWHLLDDRFASIRDLKNQFGEMVLGLVPQIRVHRSRPREALLQDKDPRHAYAESFRHLRSALLLSSGAEGRPQTLLFTGVAPGEGKTTIAFNLARTLARSGLRVLLVDTDPRAGLDHLLGPSETPGLLDCLRGEADQARVVRETEIPGLSYVSRGNGHEDGDGAFLRPEFSALMEELRRDRDFVILDGPPILAADDAALLVPQADAVMVVVRPNYTHSRLLRQALDMLYQRKAKQISLIFNQARADDLAGKYAPYASTNGKRNGATKHKPQNLS